MFQVKDFLSITAGMINHMRAVTRNITDFTVGSVARTMVEAPAVEIDQLYQQMLHGLLDGIPVAVYRSFDFERLPALPASGLVRFSVAEAATAALDIPQGTTLATAAGLQFVTTQTASLAIGATAVDVLVTATQSGAAGNVLPGEIVSVVSPALSGVTVTNPGAFTNGRAEESDDERRQRFVDYVRSLARGTIGSLLYAARHARVVDATTGVVLELVARVSVDEGPGHVMLLVHNGANATSPALLETVQRLIDGERDPATGALRPGYRPVGMRVDVRPLIEVPVDVSMTVQVAEPLRTTDLQGRIVAAVSTVIRAVPSVAGQEPPDAMTGLRPTDMIDAVLAVDEVDGVRLVTPTLITPCTSHQVLVPGTIAVTWS